MDLLCRQKMIYSIFNLLLVVVILQVGTVTSEVSTERLATFIDLATSYLVRISHTIDQDPQYPGAFTYIAHIGKELQLDEFDEYPQKSYNLLRHNGAIYSLSLSYKRYPDDEIKAAMLRGIRYLKTNAMGPVPDLERGDGSILADMLAPWEDISSSPPPEDDEEDARAQRRRRAKLGGAGLSLIALCSTEHIAPGTTDLEYIRKIGNFIEELQKDDGSTVSRFDSSHGKDYKWSSLYYPGEAALGLVYLFELETNEGLKNRWLNIATKVLLYLEELRRFKPFDQIEPDHWALLATRRLLPYLDEQSAAYWLVYEHAMKVTRSMLWSISAEELMTHKGCFTRDRRTCPTATRLEGLIASLSFVKEYEMFVDYKTRRVVTPLREKMLEYIEMGVEFLLDAQQTEITNNMQGAIPVRWPMEKEADSAVRVDYVQHSMSAILAYEELIGKSAKPTSLLGSLTKIVLFVLAFLVLFLAILLVLPDRVKKSRRYNE